MKAEHLTRLKVLPVKSDLRNTLEMFLIDCQARRLSPKTLSFYKWELDRAIVFLEGRNVNTVQAVTPTHLRAYLLSLQAKELSSGSQHASARSLRAWLNWCVREEVIEQSPMRKVQMPKRERRVLPAFSADDVTKLLSAAESPRDTAMILLLLDSGVRAAECCALNIGDVDPVSGAVHVRLGKGKKDRITYIGNEARRSVWRLLKGREGEPADAPLFMSDTRGTRLTVSGLAGAIERIGKRAGVPHCHPHTFRRSFAIWSLRAGMNIYLLARLMGHSDISILRAYLDISNDDLQVAHRDFGALDLMLKTGKKGAKP